MAYLRANFQDQHGRTNDNAYTHIHSYRVNVIDQTAKITLVTYVSQEAKENGFKPISTEVQKITGPEYHSMFGAGSTVMGGQGQMEQSMESLTLSNFYTSLNETDNWSGDDITNHFEDQWTNPEESDWVDYNLIATMLLSAYSEENTDAVSSILDEQFPSLGGEEQTLAVRLTAHKWILYDSIRLNDGEGLYFDGLIAHIEGLMTENEGGGEANEGILGCTDPTALNYNPEATTDDGSCQYGDGEGEGEGDGEGEGGEGGEGDS